MRFVAQKTDGGGKKGKIALYCRVLKVSRQGFYRHLSRRERPWKYQRLADAILFQCGPIGPADVLGAPVKVDDGSPQDRIGCRCAVQRPHTQLCPHIVIHGQTEDSEIKAVKDG